MWMPPDPMHVRINFQSRLRSYFPAYEVITFLNSDYDQHITVMLRQQTHLYTLTIPLTCSNLYTYIVQHYPELFI